MRSLVWNVSITFEVTANRPEAMLERLREVLTDFPQPVVSINASEAPRFELDPSG